MDFSYKFPSISCAGQLLPLTFIYTAKKHHAKKIGRKTEYIYLVYFRSNSLSLKKKEKSYIHFKSSASEQKVGEVHSLYKILVQEDRLKTWEETKHKNQNLHSEKYNWGRNSRFCSIMHALWKQKRKWKGSEQNQGI